MRKLIIVLIFGIIAGVLISGAYPSFQSFEEKRTNLISGMSALISEQAKTGNYRCCIDPPCTMCFLGNWIWDDGICRCDDMIAQGQYDKVCPQCKRGLEEGKCKYADSSSTKCDLDKLQGVSY